MNIEKIMSKRVVSVTMDDSLASVKDIFEHTRFHHLLVIEKGKLMGVISDRDYLKAISPNLGLASETTRDAATLNKRVHQIMTRKPITIQPDSDVFDAVALFNQHSISCLPVVDGKNAVVGILSWRDMFRALEARQKHKKSTN